MEGARGHGPARPLTLETPARAAVRRSGLVCPRMPHVVVSADEATKASLSGLLNGAERFNTAFHQVGDGPFCAFTTWIRSQWLATNVVVSDSRARVVRCDSCEERVAEIVGSDGRRLCSECHLAETASQQPADSETETEGETCRSPHGRAETTVCRATRRPAALRSPASRR